MSKPSADKRTEKGTDDSVDNVYVKIDRARFIDGAAPLKRAMSAPEYIPLSVAQRGMWMGEKIGPKDATFNLAEYCEILGEIDVPLFIGAVKRVAAEAQTWRVQIVDGDDGPQQKIMPVSTHRVPFIDLSGEAQPRKIAEQWMMDELQRPVDMAKDPLWCCALFKADEQRYFWYHRSHHIVLDGFAAGLLSRRVADIYNATLAGIEPPPCEFLGLADQLQQERDYRESPRFQRDREYWLEQLRSLPEPISLASRSAVRGGGLRRSTARLDAGQCAALKNIGAGVAGTMPQVLIALMATYIYRLSGADDLVFGMPVSARSSKAARRLPGMMANAVTIRLKMSPEQTLHNVIEQVARVVRSALRHQQYRYEALRRDLGLLAKGQQISWVGVNIEPFDYDLGFGGHPCVTHNLSNGTIEDLTFFVYDRGDNQGVRIDLDANPSLYTQDELDEHRQRLLRMVGSLLEAPDASIGQLELLSEQQRQTVLFEWNNTDQQPLQKAWPNYFERQVAITPDAIALHTERQRLSYAELNAQANQFANCLVSSGVGEGSYVAVALPRDSRLLIALLGIMKSGAAYLPLDASAPTERLALILEEARPELLISDEGLLDALPDVGTRRQSWGALDLSSYDKADSDRELDCQSAAYVIYTSGSTGRPKGVVISHGNLMNFLQGMQDELALNPADRMLGLTTISFDIATLELYLPLMTGASVVLCSREVARDPAALCSTLLNSKVTVMQATPSHWQALMDNHAEALRGLRPLVGGEALPATLAAQLMRLQQPVINLYGPTETTVWSTLMRLESGDIDAPPIGRPIRNTQVYVLDNAGQPLPVGVIGELYIGGAGVAQGYLHREDLTAERFVDNPFHGGRMYKTGDLARWRNDGVLEYLGRNDFQIKIRGFRVEAEEVEANIQRCSGVKQAVVTLRQDPRGENRLVAYLLPVQDEDGEFAILEPGVLRKALEVSLPDYMIPALFIPVASLPLNVNGKLDRKALPEPQWLVRSEYIAPRNAMEEQLETLWADIFQRDRVSIHDSFFDLGGDSLVAARMVGQLRTILGRAIPMTAIFEAATIAELAEQIESSTDADPLATLLPLRRIGAEAAAKPALFCVHPVIGLGWGYAALGRYIEHDRPLYALQSRGLRGRQPLPESIEAVAADYILQIRKVQPQGPYHLLGWSMGGIIAYEMARQLKIQGEDIGLLSILDAYPFVQNAEAPVRSESSDVMAALNFLNIEHAALACPPETMEDLSEFLCREYDIFNMPVVQEMREADVDIIENVRQIIEHNLSLVRRYVPAPLQADIVFFQAAHTARSNLGHLLHHRPEAWGLSLDGEVICHTLECDHQQMLDPLAMEVIGPVLGEVFVASPVLQA